MESMTLGLLVRVDLPPGLYCGETGRRDDLNPRRPDMSFVLTLAKQYHKGTCQNLNPLKMAYALLSVWGETII